MEGMPNAKRRDATRRGTTEAPTGGFNFYLVRTDPLTSTYTRRWAETDLPNHTAATLSGATLELVEAQQLSTTPLVVYSRVRCRSNLSKRYNARAPFHSALSQHRQMRSQRARSLMWQMKRERLPLKRPLMVKRAVPHNSPISVAGHLAFHRIRHQKSCRGFTYIEQQFKECKGRIELQRRIVEQLHPIDADAT